MFGVQGKGVKRAVSYVWQEEESKEQSHMFGVQGREESKSSSWIFLICLASKEENVYIIRQGICILCSHTHYRTKEMDSKTQVTHKPHAVCIPCPAQSHMKAMLKLSKLLHHEGFHITFVNTEFIHQRLMKFRGPGSLDNLSDFRFETIPDGLPPSDINTSQDIPSLCESIMNNFLATFFDLLVKLNSATSDNPPVTCIVSNAAMSFTITTAQEFKIPVVMFFTISACSIMVVQQIPSLKDKGIIPFKGVTKSAKSN